MSNSLSNNSAITPAIIAMCKKGEVLTTPPILRKNIIIVDSGAMSHMAGNRNLLINYRPYFNEFDTKVVLLSDGVTTIPIHGEGILDIVLDGTRVRLENCLYLPEL